MNIRARLQRLEQSAGNGGLIRMRQGGFTFIGGRNGFLKVPGMSASESEWLEEIA